MFLTALLAAQIFVSALENPKNNYPNLFGGSGNLRTFSAEPNEPTTFGVNLIGNFFTQDSFISNIKNSRNQFRVDGNYTFNWGFPIEFFAGSTFSYNDNSSSSSAKTMTTFFENTDLGIRYGRQAFYDHFYLGGYIYARALSGTRAQGNTSGGSLFKSGPLFSGGIGFTETLNLSKKKGWEKIPLRQMFSIGYRLPNGNLVSANDDFNRFSLDSFYFPAIVPAISFELLYKWLAPFFEYSMEYAIQTKAPTPSFGDNRQKATLGTRITPMSSFSILIAGDIGIGGPSSDIATGIPKNPIYDLFIGISFQTLGSKLNSQVGSVRGVVTDQTTGSPLSEVSISVVGSSLAPFATDPSGSFLFDLLPNGNYQAKFERPGFDPVVKSFSIRDGGDTILDASMMIAGPKNGSIELTIVDQDTQAPISKAFVSVSGWESGLATDENGKIQIRAILEGEHSITAEAPGYLSGHSIAQVSPEIPFQTTLALKRAPPESGLCTGVVKNAEGTPLTAVFTSSDGKVSPFGTDPLSGAFSQTFPQGSHELKVQAENYLPQTVLCNVVPGEQPPSLEITLEKPKEAVVIDNKIVLPDAIYFEFGKAEIKQESLGVLDQVVDILLKNDNYKILKVEGHTDSVGGDAPNQKLSERRAAAVRLYLIQKGVKGAKVASAGFGKAKPVATNLTTEGRAENRRVEFNLVKEEP